MSLHTLAEVTIDVFGLPEYCGTDDELQKLEEEAEALMESLDYKQLLNQVLIDDFPGLADKIIIDVNGI